MSRIQRRDGRWTEGQKKCDWVVRRAVRVAEGECRVSTSRLGRLPVFLVDFTGVAAVGGQCQRVCVCASAHHD